MESLLLPPLKAGGTRVTLLKDSVGDSHSSVMIVIYEEEKASASAFSDLKC
jgi:hypothetical protein